MKNFVKKTLFWLSKPRNFKYDSNIEISTKSNIQFGSEFIYGKNCRIHEYARISTDFGGKIKLGESVEIHKGVFISSYGGSISIGNYCSINPNSILYGHGNIKIGNYVRIAANTIIIPANHIFSNKEQNIMDQGETRKGIIIDDNVWVGANVIILDGVIIGEGSVIGAGSIVTKSIPPFSVAVGSPAKILKQR